MMRIITQFSRIFVGVLFIFSGLIKANDPLGFSYKLDEYFEVFGTEFLMPLSLFLAIFMCVLEVVLGFFLLLGARIKLTLWLLLALTVFFGFLTFYSAYYDVVKSCGCFGDAIKLTPWQSFWKDMILLAFVLILLIGQKHINSLLGETAENIAMAIIIAGTVAFPVYTYNYLPIKDFRAYAIGKNIPEQTLGKPDVLKFFYTLKNKKTAETKEFDTWPENWDVEWDYVSSRNEVVEKGVEPQIKDFGISSVEDGADYTQDIITNPNYNFLLIAYDLAKTEKDVQGRINDFYELCSNDSVSFVCLTASGKDLVTPFKAEYKINYPFYNTDGTVLKTMIRANPGLMLLKGGVVIDMWHYNSFPAYNDVKQKYFGK
ncbi:MAG: DoxX family protein [Bacteroidetes bacterium]|nr:DoxX family protein [Bacteroidota bacterium]